MTLVDNAIYVGGVRTADPTGLSETFETMRQRGGMAWIGLYRPSVAEIEAVAQEFGLHQLAVEDAVKAHQRPKLERYGSTMFTVLLPARYLDREEEVEFGELHVFTGDDFVVTIRQAESPDLAQVRHRLEASPGLLRLGPMAVLYAILDQVVDEYAPVDAGLENDIDEIEDQLFAGDPAVSRRIYQLFREVIEFQRATRPILDMVTRLEGMLPGHGPELEVRRNLRDVHDHAIRVVEHADSYRALLQNALSVNATLVGQRQNDEMQRLTETSLAQNEEVKKISGWAAILFGPTVIGGIYGMNFHNMPELHWRYGYPMALVLMVLMSVGLYALFRHRHWL